MRSTLEMPGIGSFLRWAGLLAAVLAIIGGLLGMHVMGGAQMVSMGPAAMGSPATAPDMAVSTPVAAHHTSAETPAAGPAKPDQNQSPAMCGCSPACPGSMDLHGACVPSVAPATPAPPLPGTFTRVSAWTAFTGTPSPNTRGRAPDGPSLAQLSISRT
ncbi:hypothetical protein ACQCSX_01490 [Pseudarthrobacter sp. P1]|uniref:hypothetical protein n=1 Tax=Pseudarthrobacter sp. P1 TaxID=3418418 RepID=UPI003CEBB04C